MVDTISEISASTVHSPETHSQSEGPRGPNGEHGTCYAFTAATTIRSAQMRIFSRTVEDHDKLVTIITEKYGCNGAVLFDVLEDMCTSRRLHCAQVDEASAESLVQSRAVAASFALDQGAWQRFSAFFRSAPEGVLRRENLQGMPYGSVEGHGVVVVGQSPGFWMVKNSWGEDFADEGFFRVAKDALQFSFYDVHFRHEDLSDSEIKAYCRAPAVLTINITNNRRARNPISSLGWYVDFRTLRVLAVCRKRCPIARWNTQNRHQKVLPGYEIFEVNSIRGADNIIEALQNETNLNITLIISDPCKLDDLLDERARSTCFAHAIASAIRQTQKRILGRTVEIHDEMVTSILHRHGSSIIDLSTVLASECGQRSLRYQAVDGDAVAQVLKSRSLLASFSLDTAQWKRFSQYFNADARRTRRRPLTSSILEGNLDGIQQSVVATVVGESPSHWQIKDPLSWDVGQRRVLRVAKELINCQFYAVGFLVSDLRQDEVEIYENPTTHLDIQLARPHRWIKGDLAFGWTIDVVTMQIEWIAAWGVIAQLNQNLPFESRVHPGYKIVWANGCTDQDGILNCLANHSHLTVRLAKHHYPLETGQAVGPSLPPQRCTLEVQGLMGKLICRWVSWSELC